MKTAIDAVNYYEAKWPDCFCNQTENQADMYKIRYVASLGFFPDDIDCDKYVCSMGQFNQCVDEMSGDPVKLKNWHSNKPMFEIKQKFDTKPVGVDFELTEEGKPVTVPTFTQAMADAKECPQVGAMFMVESVESDSRIIDFEGEEVTVIGLSKSHKENQVITFSHPLIGIGCGVYSPSWVKPLTPPIVLEDGKAYQFKLNDFIYIGFYAEARDSFMDRNLSGNKVCGTSQASNIQLLEVTK